jgi:hypothetical protein
MKTCASSHGLNMVCYGIRLTLLLALLLASSGCRLPPELFPADETREGISLEEAQSLAPFAICLPIYIPAGIEVTPRVTYHADFGDPMESDVRLRYYSSDDQELVIEIHQQHYGPRAATPEELTEHVRGLYIRDLLDWATDGAEVDSRTRALLTVNVAKYQDDEMVRWLFEIVEPTSLYANMVSWGSAPVYYDVYTRLSTEEAKSVVRSIPDVLDCGIEPSTP